MCSYQIPFAPNRKHPISEVCLFVIQYIPPSDSPQDSIEEIVIYKI